MIFRSIWYEIQLKFDFNGKNRFASKGFTTFSHKNSLSLKQKFLNYQKTMPHFKLIPSKSVIDPTRLTISQKQNKEIKSSSFKITQKPNFKRIHVQSYLNWRTNNLKKD